MRYAMPHFPCEFDIPDHMAGFVPATVAYRSSSNSQPVPLVAIEPHGRLLTVAKDGRGFDRARLVSVLKGS